MQNGDHDDLIVVKRDVAWIRDKLGGICSFVETHDREEASAHGAIYERIRDVEDTLTVTRIKVAVVSALIGGGTGGAAMLVAKLFGG